MFARLENGDQIKILPNILKDCTYGDTIIRKTIFYIDGVYVMDDSSNTIYKLQETKSNIKSTSRYYSYCLLNNCNYKIIYFNHTLYEKLKNNDFNKPFIIHTIDNNGYKDYRYSNYSVIDNFPLEITESFLKTKTVYLEDYFNNMIWYNSKNLSKLSGIMDFETIAKLKNRQRELKLKNILF